jgi:hypothetical protein
MKAVKQYLAEHNPDEVSKFEKGAADFAKKIVSNFKDYEFVRLTILYLSPVLRISVSTLERTTTQGVPEW